MEMHSVSSLEEIERIVSSIKNKLALNQRKECVEFFRGQSNNCYELISPIGRNKHILPGRLKELEKKIFDSFIHNVENGQFPKIQKPSPIHIKRYKFIKEWFYLFQGRHLGLTTRLFDWSLAWDIALFFAVNEKSHQKRKMCIRNK
jgi:hypothetical protein